MISHLGLTQSFPQLWTSDITPEHLGTVMAANNDAMAILSDEGGIFDILAGLYSKGKANIDLFLQAYSGASARIERRSKPPIFLKKALLTIGITAQPHVIKMACGNSMLKGRGLLGRFLYVMPQSNIGYRSLEERPMDESARVQFNSAIDSILNHSSSISNLHVLELEVEAYSKWLGYAQTVESMMSPELGYLSHITDWAGKLSGQIARLAGLLHIFRYAFENPWERKVSLQDMEAAVKIGHALISHALKVFELTEEEREISIAKEILQWILNLNIKQFTSRECHRKFRRYKKQILVPSLNLLAERGYLNQHNYKPPKGAASIIFEVNPKAQKSI